jgi:hypothetical protein
MADQHVKPWDGRNGQYVYLCRTYVLRLEPRQYIKLLYHAGFDFVDARTRQKMLRCVRYTKRYQRNPGSR